MDFNLHPPSVHSQAMDLNVYAGDHDSSFTMGISPPNGYFATQALRVGLLRKKAMHSPPLPFPDHREIGRQIIKDRIREEILAGEVAERKTLEDEVRREIEMERITKMRRHQMERTRFSLLAATSDTVNPGNRMTQSFFPSYPQARSGYSRNFERDAAEFTFSERSPSHLRRRNPMMVVEESVLHHNSEFLPSEQHATPNFKLSGAKRKTWEASPLPVKKQWGCALCEVHTTCENGLKAHLEGKKHKAREDHLASKSISRKEPLLSSEKASYPRPKKNRTLPLKGASAGGPKNKKQPPVMGASTLPLKGASASGPKNKQPPVIGASTLPLKGASASEPKNKKQPPVTGASTLQMKGTSASGSKNKKQPPLKGTSGGGPGKKFWCPVCKVRCNSEKMLESHRSGRKHKIFTEAKKDSNSFADKNSADAGAQGLVKEVAEAGAEGLTERDGN